MKASSRSSRPAFPTKDSKRVRHVQPEEKLIADSRTGLTPSAIVERRLQGLLRGSNLTAGTPQLCLPRADRRAKRTIAYNPKEGPKQEIGPKNPPSDREVTALYAISVEHSLATEILTGLRPSACPFWRTDHRGPLLIHTRTRKPAKGSAAFDRAPGRNALVGVVELVDCIASRHAGADPDEIEYLWVLVNPRVFTPPFLYPGRPGLFLVTEGVVTAALRQMTKKKQTRGR